MAIKKKIQSVTKEFKINKIPRKIFARLIQKVQHGLVSFKLTCTKPHI